eukprot:CAMPEP_0169270806 /NCGR_PEP_ID=MMETSP1016-20121227/49354_1 /TAXON_ID=342587 /ORGANISM="Karlodinium micrum, Strain CCMP2283" /LENGTH=180 /DNA_ID=CAMNT_0009356257 /DNA_START=163 /DNA_END=702 /DNA_ORIENTATION=-
MAKAGLYCERVPAVDAVTYGILPAEACRRSHLLALDRFKASGYPFGLILEDDAMWVNYDWTTMGILCHLSEASWHHPVTLLSCGTPDVTPGSGSPTGIPWLQTVSYSSCQTTSSYFIRQNYVDRLVYYGFNTPSNYPSEVPNTAIDQTWKKLQVPDLWAMTNPLLIKQRASWSNITNRHE